MIEEREGSIGNSQRSPCNDWRVPCNFKKANYHSRWVICWETAHDNYLEKKNIFKVGKLRFQREMFVLLVCSPDWIGLDWRGKFKNQSATIFELCNSYFYDFI